MLERGCLVRDEHSGRLAGVDVFAARSAIATYLHVLPPAMPTCLRQLPLLGIGDLHLFCLKNETGNKKYKRKEHYY